MKSFHVLAGPPGAGKTTVLEVLRASVGVVPEPARRVLNQQRISGGQGTGDQDRSLFVRLMLEQAQTDYVNATGLTVFDRGLPDLLAFCAHYGFPSAPIDKVVARQRYASNVFWLPPWPAIYTQDDERKLDFAGAQKFGELIRQSYQASGYSLITVPQASPKERAAFILARIGA